MAAFGSFAGMATAGVGVLCSHETYALNMFDFSAIDARSCESHTFPIFNNSSCRGTIKNKTSFQQVSHCESSCPTNSGYFQRASNTEIVGLTYSP